MKRLVLPLLVLCAVLLACSSALAQDERFKIRDDEDIDQVISSVILSNVLTLNCDLPVIRPRVVNIKRSYLPDPDRLIPVFFESRDNLLSSDRIESPRWGSGYRHKCGAHIPTIRYQRQGEAITPITGQLEEIELVPSFLDIYSSGFVYENNMPHVTMYSTDFDEVESISGGYQRDYAYQVSEGQLYAEEMLPDLFGSFSVPAGFQSNVVALIQEEGEYLFAYRVHPEYITTFDEYATAADDYFGPENNAEVVATHKVALPILDTYVLVLLDGEKILAGLEYFWDSQLSPQGTPEVCMSAFEALEYARSALMDQYNDEPPLMEVSQVKLGYVQDRQNRSLLVPAWVFDAWYPQLINWNDPTASSLSTYSTRHVEMANTFAINALTGEMIDLTPEI